MSNFVPLSIKSNNELRYILAIKNKKISNIDKK